jgi:hypothetical protein
MPIRKVIQQRDATALVEASAGKYLQVVRPIVALSFVVCGLLRGVALKSNASTVASCPTVLRPAQPRDIPQAEHMGNVNVCICLTPCKIWLNILSKVRTACSSVAA